MHAIHIVMDQKEVYRQYAAAYHTLTPLTSCHQELVRDTLKALEGKKTILDAGVGTGIVAKRLAEGGHIVYGVDSSEEMLRIARTHANSEISKGTLILSKGDILALTYSNGFFDGAVCLNVLYHLSNYKEVLAELTRTIKPEGMLVLAGPNRRIDISTFLKKIDQEYATAGIAEAYPVEVAIVKAGNAQLSDKMKTKLDASELSHILATFSFRIIQSHNNAYFGHSHFVVGQRT